MGSKERASQAAEFRSYVDCADNDVCNTWLQFDGRCLHLATRGSGAVRFLRGRNEIFAKIFLTAASPIGGNFSSRETSNYQGITGISEPAAHEWGADWEAAV